MCALMHACVQVNVLVTAQQEARSEEGREWEAAVAMVTVRLA